MRWMTVIVASTAMSPSPRARIRVPRSPISGVTPKSPADRGGLKGGDKMIRLGEYKIGNLEDFDGALRKFKAGDRVKVQVLRKGEAVDLEVTLDPPK